ncbi:hypothetical protein AMTR_s00056p00134140 [Amborella trichopoda]|uniref:Uncharacterized protein n=1 Tax=Amborella trichopoda TaxID=13333 RepID=U5CYW6_AMBTC|nr:hypothetical protein AMTR_s00056p00134140 [Amborella trichopoda]
MEWRIGEDRPLREEEEGHKGQGIDEQGGHQWYCSFARVELHVQRPVGQQRRAKVAEVAQKMGEGGGSAPPIEETIGLQVAWANM